MTYTPEQIAEIHARHMEIHTKAVNDLHIALICHNDEATQLELGDANICVLHDIKIERDPRYRMEAAGSDITDNREVFDGIDYDADVKVKGITVMFNYNVCSLIELEDLVMQRVIEFIAKHACEVAEKQDAQDSD